MELTLDELIERLKNTAFNISAITIDTDGSVHNNERLTWEDTERIIKILEQYAEIKQMIDEYKEKHYPYWNMTDYFMRILDIFKE